MDPMESQANLVPRDLVARMEHPVTLEPSVPPDLRENPVPRDPRESPDPMETLASLDTKEMLEHLDPMDPLEMSEIRVSLVCRDPKVPRAEGDPRDWLDPLETLDQLETLVFQLFLAAVEWLVTQVLKELQVVLVHRAL